jgi:hypothetical protein
MTTPYAGGHVDDAGEDVLCDTCFDDPDVEARVASMGVQY